MDLDRLGIEGIGLSDGESVDSAVNLKRGRVGVIDRNPSVVLLTNKRVIHFRGSLKRREAVFVCLEKIDSVELSRERKGYGAYVWGVLAFLVALGVYSVWDNPVGSTAAALVIAAMGVFLVVDHLITPSGVRATFRAGSSALQCILSDSATLREMQVLVDSLFRLKHREEPEPAPRVFALR